MKAIKILELLNNGEFEQLKALAQKELENEIAKGNGKAKEKSIIDKMMKKNKYEGCFVYNNKYYFLDGFRMFTSKFDYGYKKNENGLDIKSLLNSNYNEQLEINKADLMEFIATNKLTLVNSGAKKIPYIIENKIAFNAIYLLDMLNYSNTNIICYTDSLSPVFTKKDDEIISLLCPIRLPKNQN